MVEATRKSLRCGAGSGTKMVSRWQLGVVVEYMSFSKGCEERAVECVVGVMGKEDGVGCGRVGALISTIGVCSSMPAEARICEEA